MFKIGDKVRRVDINNWWLDRCADYNQPIDSIYEVVFVNDSGSVKLSGFGDVTCLPASLSLVKEETPIFKVGDKVIRKPDKYNSNWVASCKKACCNLCDIFEIETINAYGNFGLKGFNDGGWFSSGFELVKTVDTPSTQIKEEVKMSVLNRRVVDVLLMDNDKGLDVSLSLVASYKGIVTEDDDATTVQEVMMNHNIAGKLKAHNEKRTKQVDMHIRQTHGTEVFLQPVKLKDLTWVVK